MPARINNLPSYVVYDRSPQGTILTQFHGGTTTAAGLPSYTYDNNLSSAYTLVNADSSTSPPPYGTIVFDYGQIYFNCQLSFSISTVYTESLDTAIAEYSTNGTDWVVIKSTTNANLGITWLNECVNTLAMRYFRFRAYNSGGLVGGANTFTYNFYEVRLSGSG